MEYINYTMSLYMDHFPNLHNYFMKINKISRTWISQHYTNKSFLPGLFSPNILYNSYKK